MDKDIIVTTLLNIKHANKVEKLRKLLEDIESADELPDKEALIKKSLRVDRTKYNKVKEVLDKKGYSVAEYLAYFLQE